MSTGYPTALAGLALGELATPVATVLDELRAGVLDREAAGGAPVEEVAALRDAGLLIGPWSREPGAPGWTDTLGAVAELATVDPSAAFLLGYHHMHVQLLATSGNPVIEDWATRETIEKGWAWGGANNPSGAKVTVTEVVGGYRLTGTKEFATGSLGADQLIVQEASPTAESPLRRIALAVDTRSEGLTVLDDWDGIGVIRSATNRIRFENVFVPADRFIRYSRVGTEHPLVAETAAAPGFQILFANVYFGIALGALRRSYDFLHGDGDTTPNKRLAYSHVQETFGDLITAVAVARSSVAETNSLFDQIVSGQAVAVPPADFQELSRRVFETKMFTHVTVMDVTQRAFDVTGSRGAATSVGLSKFWRDARNHTLHDDVRLRQRFIGALALGVEPA